MGVNWSLSVSIKRELSEMRKREEEWRRERKVLNKRIGRLEEKCKALEKRRERGENWRK